MTPLAAQLRQEPADGGQMRWEETSGRIPQPNFGHLLTMTSTRGLWEHALYSAPRPEHGLCTDDNARALILLSRQPDLTPAQLRMYLIYWQFLQEATLVGGGFHNRRRADGTWADTSGSDDSQGRAIWALGTVARLGRESSTRALGVELFEQQYFESSSPRANAFAVLGAAEILTCEPTNEFARHALTKCVDHLKVLDDSRWPWPEERLAYDNARIPEALIAAGLAIGSDRTAQVGIRLLEWLITKETRDGHFSFTPVGGWAPGESRPGFDQQPVEAAAFADACMRAWEMTGDSVWREHILRAARWFMGANDRHCLIYDPETGGGYDGLTPSGVNLNQGAESTIAALSTLQQANRFL